MVDKPLFLCYNKWCNSVKEDSMTEQEYSLFKEFIRKLLYDTMTLDDYEIIMRRLNVPYPIKPNDSTWMYKTICHNVDPYKCKNNLAFYTETRSYYCFSECQQSYNLVTLVEKRFKVLGEPKSRFQCVKWICEQLNIPFNFKENAVQRSDSNKYNWQQNLEKYIKVKRGEVELKIYDKKILDYFDDDYHESWVKDNISLNTMIKYGIKYYKYHDSIVIPCFTEDGELCGIRERFLNPDSKMKYMPLSMLNGDSFEFPVNQTMYGLNYNATNISHYKKVVLLEAEKGTLQCDTYFGCKNFSLSLYGKSMSNAKVKKILSLDPEEVIIGLDFDYERVTDDNGEFTKEFEAFRKNVYRIGNYFKPYCKVTAMISYGGHKKNDSPTDNGKETYLELFNQREELYQDTIAE